MERTFKLGVDLDGCVGDYVSFFRNTVSRRTGVDPESLPDPTDWDFREWGLADRDAFEAMHRAAVEEDRMFAQMDAFPDASEVLWELSDAEVHIVIITHRLCVNFGHKIAAGDTVDWLERHHIPYRDLCFLKDKPTIQADMYIDDSPGNIAALQAAWGQENVIIFDALYNRHLDGIRAKSWADVRTIVSRRVRSLQ